MHNCFDLHVALTAPELVIAERRARRNGIGPNSPKREAFLHAHQYVNWEYDHISTFGKELEFVESMKDRGKIVRAEGDPDKVFKEVGEFVASFLQYDKCVPVSLYDNASGVAEHQPHTNK